MSVNSDLKKSRSKDGVPKILARFSIAGFSCSFFAVIKRTHRKTKADVNRSKWRIKRRNSLLILAATPKKKHDDQTNSFSITVWYSWVNAFWQSTINTGLEGMRRTKCQSIARSQYNAQFPHYCKVGRISVIGLDIGGGLFRLSNSQFFSFTGNVLRTSDVTFMTEQDGYGSITAKFNGAVLQCSGFSGMKRKTCVIPRAMRPWNGRIAVTVFSTGGYNPSTSYSMIGTPVCLTPGYEGDNCDTDINECEKYKDKRLCQWQSGCVNTPGSFRCTCPPGFKVSDKDFRLCDPDPPQIYSKSVTKTVMSGVTTELPCQHKPQPLAIVKWQIGNRVIAIRQANGATQTIDDTKLTVRQDGNLVIKSVVYGDAGDFFCIVLNNRFMVNVKHTLKVESFPLVDVQHLISGNYTNQHAYRVGDNVTIDCQVIAMPVPLISWTKDSLALQKTQRVKVNQTKIQDVPFKIEGALQSRLQITSVQTSDAGTYTCNATNTHGVTSKTITVSVTQ